MVMCMNNILGDPDRRGKALFLLQESFSNNASFKKEN
jgi:hypothetical protein